MLFRSFPFLNLALLGASANHILSSRLSHTQALTHTNLHLLTPHTPSLTSLQVFFYILSKPPLAPSVSQNIAEGHKSYYKVLRLVLARDPRNHLEIQLAFTDEESEGGLERERHLAKIKKSKCPCRDKPMPSQRKAWSFDVDVFC